MFRCWTQGMYRSMNYFRYSLHHYTQQIPILLPTNAIPISRRRFVKFVRNHCVSILLGREASVVSYEKFMTVIQEGRIRVWRTRAKQNGILTRVSACKKHSRVPRITPLPRVRLRNIYIYSTLQFGTYQSLGAWLDNKTPRKRGGYYPARLWWCTTSRVLKLDLEPLSKENLASRKFAARRERGFFWLAT